MRIGIIGHAINIEAENLDQSIEDLVFLTVKKALRNTGITIEEIDTIVQAGDDILDGIAINHVYTVEPAGSYLKEESKVERDGAWAVHYALARLLSGKFETAMVVAFSKGSQLGLSPFSGMSADPFYLRPVGADSDSIAGLQASYLMQRSGLSEQDLAAIASKNRANGLRNLDRTMAGEAGNFTVDQILASDPVATPIRKLTASRCGDGCVVMILATPEYIERKGRQAAMITGVGLSNDAYYPTYRDLSRLKHVDIASQKALEMAGLKLGDIQMFEVQENYAHQELMYYEALGLAPSGAGALLSSGRTRADGDLPVNPSGGTLCGNIIYASGLARLMETYLQVTNQAGSCQVSGVRKAMAVAQAGLGLQSSIAYCVEA
jgi:acetyl-CoA C-acetyltransferase